MYPQKIDVIIPIYVSNKEVLTILDNCIQSVLRKTKFPFRLILINDYSPYEETYTYLKNLTNTETLHDIILLENTTNKGFVHSVNKGMSFDTENDVLLLNSDTEVTQGWLTRMVKCAYQNDKIATVSPFSNSATILSLPTMCIDNPLPEGYSAEDIAKLLCKYSPGISPELPTAHGFCMYIKRSVLNKVGYFNEDLFDRGYGEENDFSCRCIELGYYNVLDDRTFVYHLGEASFSGSKKGVIEKHLKIIDELYPYYGVNVHNFIKNNPLKIHHEIIQNALLHKKKADVDLEEDFNEEKPAILIMTHSWGGGSERYLNDLTQVLIKKFTVYSLISFATNLLIKNLSLGNVDVFKINLRKEIQRENVISNKEYAEVLESILQLFNIKLIHINSFINHSFDISRIANKYNIPTSYILHDYNLICPTNHLIDKENKFCGICDYGEERKDCLHGNKYFLGNMTANGLHSYRKYVKELLLPNIDLFIAPSESTKKIFSDFYKYEGEIKVIPHKIKNPFENQKRTLELTTSKTEKIIIGILGSIGTHKGFDFLKKLAKEIDLARFQLVLYGESSTLIDNIAYKGKYNYEEIPNILNSSNIDLILLPSIWPETFSYTLSEAILGKIPVIVGNYGALKERTEKNGIGWAVDVKDTFEILALLEKLYDNRGLIKEKKDTLEKMILEKKTVYDDYPKLYTELINNKKSNIHFVNNTLLSYWVQPEFEILRKNKEELLDVYNSNLWKLKRKFKSYCKKTHLIYMFQFLRNIQKKGFKDTMLKVKNKLKEA